MAPLRVGGLSVNFGASSTLCSARVRKMFGKLPLSPPLRPLRARISEPPANSSHVILPLLFFRQFAVFYR